MTLAELWVIVRRIKVVQLYQRFEARAHARLILIAVVALPAIAVVSLVQAPRTITTHDITKLDAAVQKYYRAEDNLPPSLASLHTSGLWRSVTSYQLDGDSQFNIESGIFNYQICAIDMYGTTTYCLRNTYYKGQSHVIWDN